MRISDWSSDVCSSDLVASVRKIANGSLVPDSISSAVATRSFSAVALVPSSENTAAASVEPTKAPIKKPSASDRSSSQVQNRAEMPAVTSKQAVDRIRDGRRAVQDGKGWGREREREDG